MKIFSGFSLFYYWISSNNLGCSFVDYFFCCCCCYYDLICLCDYYNVLMSVEVNSYGREEEKEDEDGDGESQQKKKNLHSFC